MVVEKIEDLDTELDVIKNAEKFGVLERLDLGETDRIAPIDAEIGRQMKLSRAVLLVRECDGKSRAEEEIETHLPPRHRGEIVLEEHLERETLVGGAADPAEVVAKDVLLGLHKREACPRFEPREEFAIEAETDASRIGHRIVVGIVAEAHIVDSVRDEMGDILIINISRKLERHVGEMEIPVKRSSGLVGGLGMDASVEAATDVAHLAIERSLLIDTASEAEKHIGRIPVRFEVQTDARAEEELVVGAAGVGSGSREMVEELTIVLSADTSDEFKLMIVTREKLEFALSKGRGAKRSNLIGSGAEELEERAVGVEVGTRESVGGRERVAGAIYPFPLTDMVGDLLELAFDAPAPLSQSGIVSSFDIKCKNIGLQSVASMFKESTHTTVETINLAHYGAHAQFIKPILTLDIVVFAFVDRLC